MEREGLPILKSFLGLMEARKAFSAAALLVTCPACRVSRVPFLHQLGPAQAVVKTELDRREQYTFEKCFYRWCLACRVSLVY